MRSRFLSLMLPGVLPLLPKSVEVRWKNPSDVLTSEAIAVQSRNLAATCNGNGIPSSSDSCTLTNLKDLTQYAVWVRVCVNHCLYNEKCMTSSANYKETLPSVPQVAKDVRVLSQRPRELNVSWTIPKTALGTLASSKAIALLEETNVTSCSASDPPHTCVLSGLAQATEYTVVIEVCVTPPDAVFIYNSVAAWCSYTTGVQQRTLLEFFGSEQMAKAVEDPSTQIIVNVPLSSLPIEQLEHVNYVTAYIEPLNQTDGGRSLNRLARNRRSAEGLSFLSGRYNNETWEPWEVVSSAKAEDIVFIVGQPSDTQTCDHCYNGPLKPDTVYRIGFRIYTNKSALTTEILEFKTAQRC